MFKTLLVLTTGILILTNVRGAQACSVLVRAVHISSPVFKRKVPFHFADSRLDLHCRDAAQGVRCRYTATVLVHNPTLKTHREQVEVMRVLDGEFSLSLRNEDGSHLSGQDTALARRPVATVELASGETKRLVAHGWFVASDNATAHCYTPAYRQRHRWLGSRRNPLFAVIEYVNPPQSSLSNAGLRTTISVRVPPRWEFDAGAMRLPPKGYYPAGTFPDPEETATIETIRALVNKWEWLDMEDAATSASQTYVKSVPSTKATLVRRTLAGEPLYFMRFDLPRPTVDHGGPYVGAGWSFSASSPQLRVGYEFAAPHWAVHSLSFEASANGESVLVPAVEWVPTLGNMGLTFGAGAGIPVRIAPKLQAGARVFATGGYRSFGLVGCFDMYFSPNLTVGGALLGNLWF